MAELTRRMFLRWSAAALGGVAVRPLPLDDLAAARQGRVGRVTEWSVWVRKEPDHRASTVRRLRYDDLVVYFEEVQGEGCSL